MVVQPPFAAPLRPPVCADGSRLGRFKRFLQPPGAPGLELVHDVFGVPTRSCDDDVNMVGAAGDRVQVPATMAAMIGDRVFDEFPLSRIENQRRFGHERSGCLLDVSIRREKLAWLRNPAAFVAGKPTAVRGPSQEIGEWFILRNPPRIARQWSVLFHPKSLGQTCVSHDGQALEMLQASEG